MTTPRAVAHDGCRERGRERPREKFVGSNSFEMNSASEEQKLFPLGFTLKAAESGVCRAWLHAQALREVVDLIVAHALDGACLFDVGHAMVEPGTRDVRSLESIAAEAGVGLTMLDPEVHLMKTAHLPRLLERLEHFNLALLDVPATSTPDEAYQAVLDSAECLGHASPPVLHFARRSSLFLHSHDDCYLYLETRSRESALAHGARLLQEYVAALAGVAAREIAAPPAGFLESLLAATGSCSMFDSNSRRDGGLLRLGRDGRRYRLGDAPMPPEGWVRYDLAERLWSAE